MVMCYIPEYVNRYALQEVTMLTIRRRDTTRPVGIYFTLLANSTRDTTYHKWCVGCKAYFYSLVYLWKSSYSTNVNKVLDRISHHLLVRYIYVE